MLKTSAPLVGEDRFLAGYAVHLEASQARGEVARLQLLGLREPAQRMALRAVRLVALSEAVMNGEVRARSVIVPNVGSFFEIEREGRWVRVDSLASEEDALEVTA